MSAEDDPAELRERVEELEDTIEKMLPTRRAVLAGALGAGAGAAGVYTSSHPASAQASGQVGTSSDPVNLEAYDITADNSITDAAGVQHTGELADLSDTGGVSNPLTQDLDYSGNDAANVGDIYTTAKGDLVSDVNNADPNDIIILEPGAEYDPGQELFLGDRVMLWGPTTKIKPSSDHDILFMDNGSKANVILDARNCPTSTALSVDTGRGQNEGYSAVVNTFEFEGLIQGPGGTNSTTLVELNDSAGLGIGLGNNLRAFLLFAGGKHIHLTGNDPSAYVNTRLSNVRIQGAADAQIDLSGTLNEARTQIVGTIQGSMNADYGIRNQTSNPGPTFVGHMWDPSSYNNASLSGPDVRLFDPTYSAGGAWNAASKDSGQRVASPQQLFGSTASVYPSSDQTIPDSTTTVVSVDSVAEDGSVVSTDTANDRINIEEDGDYTVSAKVMWRSDSSWSTGDGITIQIFVNGAKKVNDTYRKVGTDTQQIRTTWTSNLTSGDNIQARLYQTSGSGQAIAGDRLKTRLEVSKT